MPVAGGVRLVVIVTTQTEEASLHQQRPVALLRVEPIALRILFAQRAHDAHRIGQRVSEVCVEEILESFGAFVEDAHVV